jgi:methionyl-tRNA synthetase
VYITTSISYANGSPHVGHAYEAVLADALARYYRDRSASVFFQTGTDEHGLKVAQAAEARGLTPQQHVDEIADLFRAMCDRLEVSYDRFIRTTEPANQATAQALWLRMEKAGDIYLGNYEGWYSVRDEAFYTDEEVTKQGGKMLSPNGTEVEWRSEPSYFFRLERHRERLIWHIENHPYFIEPESARNEMLAILREPLPDLSISRTNFKWGVPVPNDPDHVMYVWVDALSNYAVNTDHWPADTHVIGKDITKFHAIYWPAFLMSADWPLPGTILVHGFLTHNGVKMSKSLGNVIDPMTEADRVGVDALRYYLLRLTRLGNDADYTDDGPIEAYNTDLANSIGNLAQRVVSQIHKHCGGEWPTPKRITDEDGALHSEVNSLCSKWEAEMRDGRVHMAIEVMLALSARLNSYVSEQEPWVLRKSDPDRADTVLHCALVGIRKLGDMLHPIVPAGAQRLWTATGWTGNGFYGSTLPVVPAVFPRIDA